MHTSLSRSFAALCLSLSLYSHAAPLPHAETRTVAVQTGQQAVLKAHIKGDHYIDYLFNARAGQLLDIRLTSNHAANYFNLLPPGEQYQALFIGSSEGAHYQGQLTQSGDYRIRVYLMRAAARRHESANFSLQLKLADKPDISHSHDALVAGTPYHASGSLACQPLTQATALQCAFGVKRSGKADGSGEVFITLPDGRQQIIRFRHGQPFADNQLLRSERQQDNTSITLGDIRIEIPDAVIHGG